MIKRHNNVGRIIAQVIEANNRKKLIKSISGQIIHWNQELRLPDEINNPIKFPNVFDREESRRRPDIWYYAEEKRGEKTELVFNLIEVTIPWNDAVINQSKFDKEGEWKYKLEPFTSKDIIQSSLAVARDKKVKKYEPIVKEENLEVIQIKHKVSSIKVEPKFIIISSLGIVPKATENDMCSIVSSEKNEKLRYGRMLLKRMINQAVRGSFECFVNVDKVVADIDHVTEINEDIMNLDNSINMNLWTLNEEMRFDLKFKEKLPVEEKRLVKGKYINPKHFITLPDLDRDIVLEKNLMQTIINLPEADESNIIVESETEPKPDDPFCVYMWMILIQVRLRMERLRVKLWKIILLLMGMV
jgi:hypothetical protein